VSTTCAILGAALLDPAEPSQPSPPVDIFVQDGRIAEIRPAGAAEVTAAEVIDARGWLAMPGLVNAHVHSSGAFNRGLVDNLPLELFMLYELPPFDFGPFAPALYRARVLYGTLEMMRRGVTAVFDDPIYAPGPTTQAVDAVMGAYEELGVRATVTIYQPDKPELEWFPFLSELLEPDLLARFLGERPPPVADIMSTYREFIGRWHGAAAGRLRCAVSPSAPQRATEPYLLELHALAAEHDLPFVVHVYESKLQRVAEQLRTGRSLVRYLRNVGALDRRTCVVHAVWIDDADIADLSAAGATVVHSPAGNLRCGSGQLPYRPLLDAGVPIALCTDEATVEDTNNLWNVGRLAALLHKNAGPDYGGWPTAAEILEAMTHGGARAMALEHEIGTLRVGSRADLILVDLSTSTYLPLSNLANHLVYGEDGSAVRRVMIDGRVVVSDGRVLTVDESALLAEVRELMPAWLKALEPAAWWAGRLHPAFDEMYRRCAATDVGFTRWTDPQQDPGASARAFPPRRG
jgi:cytosine/adenosine deaminase-related metal-dependent hydrolase